MKVLKQTRLSGNPYRPKAKRNRKMSPRQIRFFGTKRQKAALKAKRTTKRNAAPRHVVRLRARPIHRARTRPNRNPLVVTLHPVAASNPHTKRRNTVKAKSKRRVSVNRRRVNVHHRRASNPRRRVAINRRRHNIRHHRRRTNPTRIVVMAPRRANRKHNRRHNPTLFGGSLGSKNTLKIIGGGLVGVAAAKFIPQILPASITSSLGTSSLAAMLVTGVSAVAAGWIAGKLDTDFGNGVLFGGLMQTASVGLNAFLPNFQIAGVPISLGDLVQGQFAVPQNPMRGAYQNIQRQLPPASTSAPANMPAASGMKVTTSGLGRAYPAAY